MKRLVLAVVFTGGVMALAQAPKPSPAQPNSAAPNFNPLFQLPPAFNGQAPALRGQRPQFKLEIPRNGQLFLPLPGPILITPPHPQPDAQLDPGMILHPPQSGFAHQPARPAQPRSLYPDLKVLPIEIASIDLGPIHLPGAKLEPIPITWPHAKIEPIPITWEGYRMIPVQGAAATANKTK